MTSPRPNSLSQSDREFIEKAAQYFQNPGVVIKGLNALGSGVDKAQKLLPEGAQKKISAAVTVSLQKALKATLSTVSKDPSHATLTDSNSSARFKGRLHTVATTLTGGVGGFFGLAALPIELPLTTMVMLRSIASTATEFGENLNSPQTALECLVVLTLGGPGTKDDLSDTAYYALRSSLAVSVEKAAAFIASKQAKQVAEALANGSAPALVNFIARVAGFFEVKVTRKLLAQAAPVVGGVGGAALNAAFTEFYNQAARYHFGLRKLEREYGQSLVQSTFEAASKSRAK